MTFNRYICFCAILESIGAIACMLMALIGNNLLGVIVAAIAALLWIGGEVWGMTAFRRQNPRRDELSDMHQGSAMQFALVSLVGILVIVGFIYTTLNLIDRSIVHIIPPMLLPALAMCALAISDIRYLWLEQVVPEKLRTLDRGRPWRDSQFASTRLSPSRDMSR